MGEGESGFKLEGVVVISLGAVDVKMAEDRNQGFAVADVS